MGERVACSLTVVSTDELPKVAEASEPAGEKREEQEAGEDLNCVELWIEFSRGLF